MRDLRHEYYDHIMWLEVETCLKIKEDPNPSISVPRTEFDIRMGDYVNLFPTFRISPKHVDRPISDACSIRLRVVRVDVDYAEGYSHLTLSRNF